MAETSTNVSEGSGKRIHGWDRTISSVLVQDQFTIPSEYPYASYVAHASNVSAATAADHLMQVMAGSTNYVRIRRIRVEQYGLITSAASQQIQLLRLTTAGTGGTSVTPAKFDTGDAASGATAMTLPSAKGTESTILDLKVIFAMQTAPTSGLETPACEWIFLPNEKPLIIPAGTSNGLAVKCLSARAGLTVSVTVEFVETAWLGA